MAAQFIIRFDDFSRSTKMEEFFRRIGKPIVDVKSKQEGRNELDNLVEQAPIELE